MRRLAALTLVTLASTAAAHGSAGELDASFGAEAGRTVLDLGSGFEQSADVAVRPDGKVLANASSANQGALPDFAIIRLDRFGLPDSGFGAHGVVRTDFGSTFDVALSLSALTDGRVVAAGTTVAASNDFALARYERDGSLDPTFGGDGRVVTDIASPSIDAALDVVALTDGRIVAGGVSIAGGDSDFVVVRYLADGSLDPSFGSGGVARVDLGGTDNLDSIAMLPGGKILAAGSSNSAGTFDYALARLNADGGLDTAFGQGGVVRTDVSGEGDFLQAAAVQPNGDIAVAGSSLCCLAADFQVIRYTADGSLDERFGGDGLVSTDLGSGADTPRAIAFTPDGSVVVGGSTQVSGTGDVALVRYTPSGQLDAGFGVGGVALADFGSTNEGVAALTLTPAGEVVVTGNTTSLGGFDTAVFVAKLRAR